MNTIITRFFSLAAACTVILFSQLPAGAASVTLPATGQTKCYDTAGAEINCTLTRQDGALLMGAAWPTPRFTDNYNGTFTDNLTGLVWMKNVGCITANWTNAMNAVNDLASGQCGLTDGSVAGDWRLPNINEAYSMLDNSTDLVVSGHLFSGNVYSIFTSSTYLKDTGNAYYVSTWPPGGMLNYVSKTTIQSNYIICVRDPK